jgi:hypothetical protein
MAGLQSVIQRAVVTAFKAIGDIAKAGTLVCKNQREYDPVQGENLPMSLVSQDDDGATLTVGNGKNTTTVIGGVGVPTLTLNVDEREQAAGAVVEPGVIFTGDAISEDSDEWTFKFTDAGPIQEVTVEIPRIMFGNFEEKEVQRAINRGDDLLSTDRKISIPRLYLAGIQPAKGDKITATDEDWIVHAVLTKDPASALVVLSGRKP